jgi:Polyketide cyclase / dehydrase and lipid transport
VAGYGFVTRWHLEAPIEEVWEAIYHCEHWPEWWNGVESVVELEPGDAQRVGSLWRCRWKSALPYALNFDLRVTRVVPPVALDGVAGGELAGEGLWRLFRSSAGTLVRYEWNVVTTARWMNALAPLARRVFAWNHDIVMQQGGEGLARLMAGSHGS